MAELKTKKTKASVSKYIAGLDSERRRKEAKELVKLFKDVTKKQPAMWGPSIIGFGSYHYKSERSSQEGDWPLTGFSPRKAKLSIYIMPGFEQYEDLLKKLGKHKKSVSCLYVNKLEDIDLKILKQLVKESVKEMKRRYPAK